jgi:hypothetical protein
MGYPVSSLAPTLSTSDPLFAAKIGAFQTYAPYDASECQTYSQCVSQGRGEGSWLLRQYVVTPALATTVDDGSAQTPVTLPTGPDVALQASAKASSTSGNQGPSAVIDGNPGG